MDTLILGRCRFDCPPFFLPLLLTISMGPDTLDPKLHENDGNIMRFAPKFIKPQL
jgi:hypothetical protein